MYTLKKCTLDPAAAQVIVDKVFHAARVKRMTSVLVEHAGWWYLGKMLLDTITVCDMKDNRVILVEAKIESS